MSAPDRRPPSPQSPLRVLVIGGYGVFGQLLCRRLLRGPAVDLMVGGRSPARAEAFAADLARQFPDQAIRPFVIDCTADLTAPLATAGPDLVVHAAGPFQESGYRVAEACIAQGCHYIDLADGRDFVAGIAALDGRARAAGVLVVSGASTLPALSAAVVDHLGEELTRIDSIAIGITPGNRAPRGRAVVESILSYSGKPFSVWRDGRWQRTFGWQNLRRRSLPGLGPRWFSDCDVPDLTLFPECYPDVRTVSFQAGLELSLLHLGLWALTWPARWRLLPSLRPLAPALLALAKAFEPFGSDRGGMFVELTGLDSKGAPKRRLWTLLAESGDGPNIPVTPAVVLAGKLASGELARRGAGPCLDLMTLSDFQTGVSELNIHFL